MEELKILELKSENKGIISKAILRFIRSLKSKDFALTSKQFYKVFVFMEKLSYSRKDFAKGLAAIVKEGFLREIPVEEKIYYEINHTRFKMETVLNRE